MMPILTPSKAILQAAVDLEQAIKGIIPQSTHTAKALKKIKELFTQTTGEVEKQPTPREQTKLTHTQRVHKAAWNRNKNEENMTEETIQAPSQITTQAQKCMINQEVALYM